MSLAALLEMMRDKRVVVLTGAGVSTESGIPDYRGPDTPPRKRPPIQHREFVDHEVIRRRYWARSLLGWPRFSAAQPNAGHRALASLEHRGALAGLITQNVDGLHQAAGSTRVVELHGALSRVRCLSCATITDRHELQRRLVAANPTWQARAADVQVQPDGDAELPDDLVADFALVPCTACGGTLMPDVVFFGGNVPRDTLDAAWETFDRAELLLVVGSSLTVFSGYRFVRRAAERAIPVAILNRGPTRGDPHAALRVDEPAGRALVSLASGLDRSVE
jgi:NAD+-dependent protein deacetylase sirtuin 4